MMRKYFNRIPNLLKNRYTITSIFFVVWVFFFDTIDIISLMRYRGELQELRSEQTRYQKQIEVERAQLEALTTDPERLERFAREEYYMRKENEVVYVFVKK